MKFVDSLLLLISGLATLASFSYYCLFSRKKFKENLRSNSVGLRENEIYTERSTRKEAESDANLEIKFTSKGPEYIQQLKSFIEKIIINEEDAAINDYREFEKSIESLERDLSNKREILEEYKQKLCQLGIDYVIDTSRNISTNLAFLIQIFIVVVGIMFNKIILEVFGLSLMETWLMSFIMGSMIVANAHLTGMWKKRRKNYYAIGSGLFVVIALISVAYARAIYFKTDTASFGILGINIESLPVSIIFLAANFLLSTIAFFIGYEYSDEYPSIQMLRRKIEDLELNLEDLYQEQKKKAEIHLANTEQQIAKFKFYEAAYFNEYNRLTGSRNNYHTKPPTIPDKLYELAGIILEKEKKTKKEKIVSRNVIEKNL